VVLAPAAKAEDEAATLAQGQGVVPLLRAGARSEQPGGVADLHDHLIGIARRHHHRPIAQIEHQIGHTRVGVGRLFHVGAAEDPEQSRDTDHQDHNSDDDPDDGSGPGSVSPTGGHLRSD
jgi:hypothetical protein